MINGLYGGSAGLCWDSFNYPSYFFTKKETVTVFGSTVAMEMKDQDVSHRGMVTSGHECPCLAVPVTITQQRDKGNGAMAIWKHRGEGAWGGKWEKQREGDTTKLVEGKKKARRMRVSKVKR